MNLFLSASIGFAALKVDVRRQLSAYISLTVVDYISEGSKLRFGADEIRISRRARAGDVGRYGASLGKYCCGQQAKHHA